MHELRKVPIELLERGCYQPRQKFDPIKLRYLAETIEKDGVLLPLIIRPHKTKLERFEIIAGERRWQAAQMVGLFDIPCLIRNCSDEEANRIAIIENTSRENLNPIEEAISIKKTVEEFNYSHEEMAGILGKDRVSITNLLRLLKLDRRVRELIELKELTETHGRLLAALPEGEQYPFASECIKNQWSSRALEKAIKSHVKISEKNATPGAGSSDGHIRKIERDISDCFGHPIKIAMAGKSSGTLNIHFSNLDDFENIAEKLGYKNDHH